MKQAIIGLLSIFILTASTCNEDINFSTVQKTKVTNLFSAYAPSTFDSVECYAMFPLTGGIHHEILLHLNARMVFVVQPNRYDNQGAPFIKLYVDADKHYSFSEAIVSFKWSRYSNYRAIELHTYSGTVDYIIEAPKISIDSVYKKLLGWQRLIHATHSFR